MESVGHIIMIASCQADDANFQRIDKLMFNPVDIPHWIVLIYERQQRFRQEIAGQMITGFVNACRAVGTAIQAISTATGCTQSSQESPSITNRRSSDGNPAKEM
jgi:hypothetical protein